MAYAQGAIVLVDNSYADGRRPVMIVSNETRPFQGKQYTIALISTTERDEAVRLDANTLTAGRLDVYPSFVNPWSLHEIEHAAINRRVAQLSDSVIQSVADSIARYTEYE